MQAGCFAWRRSPGPEEAGSPPRGSTSRFGTRRETTAPPADAEGALGRAGTPCPPTEPAVLAKKRRTADENPQLLCHNAPLSSSRRERGRKNRKAARNHGCNHRKDKNINFSPPNHQQKHVFTPCTFGEMQAEIRTFRRLERKPGGGVFILFQGFPNEKQKRIDNAQEDAPQIVHFHASTHPLCPLVQRLPASTLKINALTFRFVGHNGQRTAASGAQFPVFRASSTTKSRYFTSEGR